MPYPYRDLAKIYTPEREEPVPFFNNYGRDRSNYLLKDERAPYGARPFSWREFARLHGFIGFPCPDDDYTFAGEYNAKYQQIADSVQPPVAYAIGRAVMDYFRAVKSLKIPQSHLGYREVDSPRALEERQKQPVIYSFALEHRSHCFPKQEALWQHDHF